MNYEIIEEITEENPEENPELEEEVEQDGEERENGVEEEIEIEDGEEEEEKGGENKKKKKRKKTEEALFLKKLSRQKAEEMVSRLHEELEGVDFDIDLDNHSEYFTVHVGEKILHLLRRDVMHVDFGTDNRGLKRMGIFSIKDVLKARIMYPELPLTEAIKELDIKAKKIFVVDPKKGSTKSENKLKGEPFRFSNMKK